MQMEQTRTLMDFPEFAEYSSDRIKTCPGPSQLSLPGDHRFCAEV